MGGLRIFLLLVIAAVLVEALYRWGTGLAMDLPWLVWRALFFSMLFAVQMWIGHREARRERAGGRAHQGLLLPIFLLLLGGAGTVASVWRMILTVCTGRVLLTSVPADTYASLSDNPWGYWVAMGVGMLGIAMFLLLFLGGVAFVWQFFAQRRGPAGA